MSTSAEKAIGGTELLGDDRTVRGQTGSRKVSAIVLPRRLLSETAWPRWSTRLKAGAGTFPLSGGRRSPARRSGRRSGQARPTRSGRRRAARSHRGEVGQGSERRTRSGSRRTSSSHLAVPGGSAITRLGFLGRRAAPSSVRGSRRRRRAPSGSCCLGWCRPRRRSRSPRSTPSRRGRGRDRRRRHLLTFYPSFVPVKEQSPIASRQITTNRLTAQPCAASKLAKLATQEERDSPAGGLDIVSTMAVSVPGVVLWGRCPCQKPRPRPCLEHRHPDEEEAGTGQDRAAEPGIRPRALGQSDEDPGDAIEEGRSGCPEQSRSVPGRISPRRPHRRPR